MFGQKVEPAGFTQLVVYTSPAVGFSAASIPPSANAVLLVVASGTALFRDDGAGAPTPTSGVILTAGEMFEYTGNLQAIQFIARARRDPSRRSRPLVSAAKPHSGTQTDADHPHDQHVQSGRGSVRPGAAS
jgi:hypothetical protein